jgi:hypothetical protein
VLAVEVAKLRELAAARGRDADAITVAVKVPVRVGGTASPRPMLSGAPADIAGDLAAFRDAGATHIALDFVATDPGEMAETLTRFAEEVRPAVT